MREQFKEIALRGRALRMVEQANAILSEYEADGLVVTLRQLYYQFVQRDLIPNNVLSYRRLARVLSDGRLAGLIDWEAIEDRGRRPLLWRTYNDAAQCVHEALDSFCLDRWVRQPKHVELWVEKDALSSVLTPIADRFQAPMVVNKGYRSTSAMYGAAQRMIETGKPVALLYLGDFDPSGEDMVRDIAERLGMFGVHDLTVEKLALNPDQIKKYKPPPNPAKVQDPRAAEFIRRHGASSWEVDALNPRTLTDLITRAFEAHIDRPTMDKVIARETAERDTARRLIGEKREPAQVEVLDYTAAVEVTADDRGRLELMCAQANDAAASFKEARRKALNEVHGLREALRAAESRASAAERNAASLATQLQKLETKKTTKKGSKS